MTSGRVFLIGLDAADKDLVEKWAAEGYLPNFSKLLKKSLYGDIDTPKGFEAGSVWPSFYFGLQPGRMGQYDGARHFDSDDYEHKSYQPEEDSTPPIWTTLSEAGKRCAVIDAPYNYPIDSINGIKVVDRAGHVPAGGGNFLHLRTHPSGLAKQIEERFGPDPAGGRSSDFFAMDTLTDINSFRRIYCERIEKKTDMILHLWQQEPWDFFMSVYTEAHCAGHRCWHLHDNKHDLYDAKLVELAGNPLRDIYIALDTAIGRLLSEVKSSARIILYLSHGMGPRRSATRVLDRILARLDDKPITARAGLFMDLGRKIWRVIPENMRTPFLTVRKRLTNDGFQPNRAGRRFFEVYANDRTAGIRINLKGREAQGIVSEKDYEPLCAELIGEMYKLKNPESGELAVREVIRVRDFYSGQFFDDLPDLLVTWNRASPINFLESAKVGIVDSLGIDMKIRTGDHRIKGRFFALADDWQRQKLSHNVKTEDFAPTIASLLSVKLDQTDGHVIKELLKKNDNPSSEKCDNLYFIKKGVSL
jgi:predicted AlkP superfamily phosphohydrolase/phosphomutase